MKKYLFGLLVGLPIIIGMTMATNINISCSSQYGCTPDYITKLEGNYNLSVNSCTLNNNFDIDIQYGGEFFIGGNCNNITTNINSINEGIYSGFYFDVVDNECIYSCDEYEEEEYDNCYNACYDEVPDTYTVSLTFTNEQENEGGNEGGNTGGGVISDGFGSFTPVITGIKDTIFQLIPLVIYIGIGVLISILGFYAIRWLVNWLGGKINSYFNSKRD